MGPGLLCNGLSSSRGFNAPRDLANVVRCDRYRQEMNHRLNGSSVEQEQSAVLPRAGLTHLIDRQ